MTTTVDARVLRRRGLIWLAVALGVALVTGVVWVTGGFENGARPYMGPEAATGEQVETRFWDLTVHGATINRSNGSLDVEVDVTNKLPDSTTLLTSNILMVRLGDGEVLFRNYCTITDRSSFAPQIRTRAVCQYGFEDSEVPEPGPGDAAVTVIILDQEIYSELLEADRPRGSVAAGHIELVAVDVPVEEEP